MGKNKNKNKNRPARFIARKAKKRYEFVEFESELFEGVFRLPRFTQMSLKAIEELNRDPAAILRFFKEAGVEQTDIDAIASLDGEELASFMDDWQGGVTIHPKSMG